MTSALGYDFMSITNPSTKVEPAMRYPSFFPRLIAFLRAAMLALTVIFSTCWLPALRAAATTAQEKDWITVPGSFLDSRLVRRPDVAPRQYRVILDVAADPDAKPRVTQSSGDEVIDGIAWDYVKAVLRPTRSHFEAARGKELRFQLRLVPVAIAVRNLQIPPNLLVPPARGYFTPKPPYAREALLRRNTGTCQLRLAFPAAGGRPLEVALVESTGNKLLDAVTVQWAVYRWLSAPTGREHRTTVPVTYQLR